VPARELSVSLWCNSELVVPFCDRVSALRSPRISVSVVSTGPRLSLFYRASAGRMPIDRVGFFSLITGKALLTDPAVFPVGNFFEFWPLGDCGTSVFVVVGDVAVGF
jgi:hypothetical protein